MHRLDPTYNVVKAAVKWKTSKCPLCRVHEEIKREIRWIYKLKSG